MLKKTLALIFMSLVVTLFVSPSAEASYRYHREVYRRPIIVNENVYVVERDYPVVRERYVYPVPREEVVIHEYHHHNRRSAGDFVGGALFGLFTGLMIR